jgi:RNA polymerase sigma-70 factor (ECF subfamily)
MNAVDRVFRESYGKVLACLLRDGYDLAVAEDAIGVSLERATRFWATHGPPSSPEAWLLTVSRRAAVDLSRQRAREARGQVEFVRHWQVPPPMDTPEDQRLDLFFLCAHPAILPEDQSALMLQLLFGLPAERIAELYGTPPATLAQRLVRAKRSIRAEGQDRFRAEDRSDGEGFTAVLDALYGGYCVAWENPFRPASTELADEIMHLARMLADLLPREPEVSGLVALILFSESRRAARRSEGAQYVTLSRQDIRLWNRDLCLEAESYLRRASNQRTLGRYQLEAAIQSAHMSRRTTGDPPLDAILRLYDGLIAIAPTWAAHIGRLAVLAQVHGPEVALLELESLDALTGYQPYWALRAQLMSDLGRPADAAEAATLAATLAEDEAVSSFLRERYCSPTDR